MPQVTAVDDQFGTHKVLKEGVSCADHFRGAQPFETAHWPWSASIGLFRYCSVT
jgi:hypothetical protein